MKKNLLLLVSMVVVLCLTSCSSIVNSLMESKFSKRFTVEKIEKLVTKEYPEVDYLGYINGIDFVNITKHDSILGGVPVYILFDNQGRMIDMTIPGGCIKTGNDVLRNLGDESSIRYLDKSAVVDTLISSVKYFGDAFNANTNKDYDYVLYEFCPINFDFFTDAVHVMNSSAKSNNDIKVLTVYINCNVIKE